MKEAATAFKATRILTLTVENHHSLHKTIMSKFMCAQISLVTLMKPSHLRRPDREVSVSSESLIYSNIVSETDR